MFNNEYRRPIAKLDDSPVRGIVKHIYSNSSYKYGHVVLNIAREPKHRSVQHTMSKTVGNVALSSANNDSNNDGGGDGDGDGGEESGGDDDPANIVRPLPIVYNLVFPSHFLNCLFLAGTAWIFKDSFLAAIPLIGLCALCAFSEKL